MVADSINSEDISKLLDRFFFAIAKEKIPHMYDWNYSNDLLLCIFKMEHIKNGIKVIGESNRYLSKWEVLQGGKLI